MKPPADAPAVEDLADSEPDGYLDTDVGLAVEGVGEADLARPAVAKPRVPGQAGPVDAGLTERERQVLAFERRWWRHAGAKEQAIRDTFDLSATRYYQILNGLLDNPAALAAEPLLIGRLRRLRASQARARRR